MDEQLVLEIYNRNKFSERGISLDKFKRDIVNDEILRNEIYTRSKFKDRGISLSKFETDLGITSVSNEPKESKGIFDYVTQAARSQKSTSGIGEKIKSESYDTTTTYGKLQQEQDSELEKATISPLEKVGLALGDAYNYMTGIPVPTDKGSGMPSPTNKKVAESFEAIAQKKVKDDFIKRNALTIKNLSDEEQYDLAYGHNKYRKTANTIEKVKQDFQEDLETNAGVFDENFFSGLDMMGGKINLKSAFSDVFISQKGLAQKGFKDIWKTPAEIMDMTPDDLYNLYKDVLPDKKGDTRLQRNIADNLLKLQQYVATSDTAQQDFEDKLLSVKKKVFSDAKDISEQNLLNKVGQQTYNKLKEIEDIFTKAGTNKAQIDPNILLEAQELTKALAPLPEFQEYLDSNQKFNATQQAIQDLPLNHKYAHIADQLDRETQRSYDESHKHSEDFGQFLMNTRDIVGSGVTRNLRNLTKSVATVGSLIGIEAADVVQMREAYSKQEGLNRTASKYDRALTEKILKYNHKGISYLLAFDKKGDISGIYDEDGYVVNLDEETLTELANTNKTSELWKKAEWETNWGSGVKKGFDVAVDLGFTIGLSALTGGGAALAGAKAASKSARMIQSLAIFPQFYGQGAIQAIREGGLTPNEASFYSIGSTIAEIASEGIIPMAGNIVTKATLISKLTKEFTKREFIAALNTVTRKEAIQMYKNATVASLKEMGLNLGGETVEELVIDLFTPMYNKVANGYLQGEFKNTDLPDKRELAETAFITVVGTSLMGTMSARNAFNELSSNQYIISSIAKVADKDNAPVLTELLKQYKDNNKITEEDYAEFTGALAEVSKKSDVLSKRGNDSVESQIHKERIIAYSFLKNILEGKKSGDANADKKIQEDIDKYSDAIDKLYIGLDNIEKKTSLVQEDEQVRQATNKDNNNEVGGETDLTFPSLSNKIVKKGQKIISDYDDTIINKDGTLTDWGKDLKAKIESGEVDPQNVFIASAREDTQENVKAITSLLGIPQENVSLGKDAEGKAAYVRDNSDDAEGSGVMYVDNNKDNINVVGKTKADVIEYNAAALKEEAVVEEPVVAEVKQEAPVEDVKAEEVVEPVIEEPKVETAEVSDVEIKRAEIEKKRQDALNNLKAENLSVMASDYLLNGGVGAILSSDYFIQGLMGSFTNASSKIAAIRNKYANEVNSKYGNLSDFVGTDLYNKMINEIRDVINSSYSTQEAQSILDEILKYPSGVPTRLGHQLSGRLDDINNTIDKINAKYNAELAALEQTKPKEQKVEAKKADIEKRWREGDNKDGSVYKSTTKEKNGLVITNYEAYNKEDGKKYSISGRKLTKEEFLSEYEVDEDYLDLLDGVELIVIREVRDNKGNLGITVRLRFKEGWIDAEIAAKYNAELAALEQEAKKAETKAEPPKKEKAVQKVENKEAPPSERLKFQQGQRGQTEILIDAEIKNNYTSTIQLKDDAKTGEKSYRHGKLQDAIRKLARIYVDETLDLRGKSTEDIIKLADSLNEDVELNKKLFKGESATVTKATAGFGKNPKEYTGIITYRGSQGVEVLTDKGERIRGKNFKILPKEEEKAVKEKPADITQTDITKELSNIDKKKVSKALPVTLLNTAITEGSKKLNEIKKRLGEKYKEDNTFKALSKLQKKLLGSGDANKIFVDLYNHIKDIPEAERTANEAKVVKAIESLIPVTEVKSAAPQEKAADATKTTEKKPILESTKAFEIIENEGEYTVSLPSYKGRSIANSIYPFLDKKTKREYDKLRNSIDGAYGTQEEAESNLKELRDFESRNKEAFKQAKEAIDNIVEKADEEAKPTAKGKETANTTENIEKKPTSDEKKTKEVKADALKDVESTAKALEPTPPKETKKVEEAPKKDAEKTTAKAAEEVKETKTEKAEDITQEKGEYDDIIGQYFNNEGSVKNMVESDMPLGEALRSAEQLTDKPMNSRVKSLLKILLPTFRQNNIKVVIHDSKDSLAAQAVRYKQSELYAMRSVAFYYGKEGSLEVHFIKSANEANIVHEFFHPIISHIMVHNTALWGKVKGEMKAGGTLESFKKWADNNYEPADATEEAAVQSNVEVFLDALSQLSQDRSFTALAKRIWNKILRFFGINNTVDLEDIIGNETKLDNIARSIARALYYKQMVQIMPVDDKLKSHVDAWHGSPYDFDKFSTDKIGTGEGAQAFGWGIYFTDLKSIAMNYAKVLSRNIIKKPKITFDGQTLSNLTAYKIETYLNQEQFKDKKALINKIQEFLDAAILEQQSYKDENLKIGMNKYIDTYTNEIKALKNAKTYSYDKGQNLYKATLHKDKTPDQYTWLEWDKPLSKKQKELIKEQIRKEYPNNELFKGMVKYELQESSLLEGRDIYQGISKFISFEKRDLNSDKEASLFLLRAGIDGVKYPAESISRGMTSDNARGFNYVVFDENAVTIEDKVKFMVESNPMEAADNTLNQTTPNQDTELSKASDIRFKNEGKEEQKQNFLRDLETDQKLKAEISKNIPGFLEKVNKAGANLTEKELRNAIQENPVIEGVGSIVELIEKIPPYIRNIIASQLEEGQDIKKYLKDKPVTLLKILASNVIPDKNKVYIADHIGEYQKTSLTSDEISKTAEVMLPEDKSAESIYKYWIENKDDLMSIMAGDTMGLVKRSVIAKIIGIFNKAELKPHIIEAQNEMLKYFEVIASWTGSFLGGFAPNMTITDSFNLIMMKMRMDVNGRLGEEGMKEVEALRQEVLFKEAEIQELQRLLEIAKGEKNTKTSNRTRHAVGKSQGAFAIGYDAKKGDVLVDVAKKKLSGIVSIKAKLEDKNYVVVPSDTIKAFGKDFRDAVTDLLAGVYQQERGNISNTRLRAEKMLKSMGVWGQIVGIRDAQQQQTYDNIKSKLGEAKLNEITDAISYLESQKVKGAVYDAVEDKKQRDILEKYKDDADVKAYREFSNPNYSVVSEIMKTTQFASRKAEIDKVAATKVIKSRLNKLSTNKNWDYLDHFLSEVIDEVKPRVSIDIESSMVDYNAIPKEGQAIYDYYLAESKKIKEDYNKGVISLQKLKIELDILNKEMIRKFKAAKTMRNNKLVALFDNPEDMPLLATNFNNKPSDGSIIKLKGKTYTFSDNKWINTKDLRDLDDATIKQIQEAYSNAYNNEEHIKTATDIIVDNSGNINLTEEQLKKAYERYSAEGTSVQSKHKISIENAIHSALGIKLNPNVANRKAFELDLELQNEKLLEIIDRVYSGNNPTPIEQQLLETLGMSQQEVDDTKEMIKEIVQPRVKERQEMVKKIATSNKSMKYIADLIASGRFSMEDIKQLFGEKYNFTSLENTGQMDKLRALTEKALHAPLASDRDAAIDKVRIWFIDHRNVSITKGFFDIITDIIFIGYLNGIRTFFTSLFGSIGAIIKDSTLGLATSILTGRPDVFIGAAGLGIAAIAKKGIPESIHIIMTGESSNTYMPGDPRNMRKSTLKKYLYNEYNKFVTNLVAKDTTIPKRALAGAAAAFFFIPIVIGRMATLVIVADALTRSFSTEYNQVMSFYLRELGKSKSFKEFWQNTRADIWTNEGASLMDIESWKDSPINRALGRTQEAKAQLQKEQEYLKGSNKAQTFLDMQRRGIEIRSNYREQEIFDAAAFMSSNYALMNTPTQGAGLIANTLSYMLRSTAPKEYDTKLKQNSYDALTGTAGLIMAYTLPFFLKVGVNLFNLSLGVTPVPLIHLIASGTANVVANPRMVTDPILGVVAKAASGVGKTNLAEKIRNKILKEYEHTGVQPDATGFRQEIANLLDWKKIRTQRFGANLSIIDIDDIRVRDTWQKISYIGGSVIGTALTFMLGSMMYDWDDDDNDRWKISINPDSNIRVTGAGYPGFTKNQSIDDDYAPFSLQVKNQDGKWKTLINLKNSIFMLMLMPLGKIHDILYVKDPTWESGDDRRTANKFNKSEIIVDIILGSSILGLKQGLTSEFGEPMGALANLMQGGYLKSAKDENKAMSMAKYSLSQITTTTWGSMLGAGSFGRWANEQFMKEGDNKYTTSSPVMTQFIADRAYLYKKILSAAPNELEEWVASKNRYTDSKIPIVYEDKVNTYGSPNVPMRNIDMEYFLESDFEKNRIKSDLEKYVLSEKDFAYSRWRPEAKTLYGETVNNYNPLLYKTAYDTQPIIWNELYKLNKNNFIKKGQAGVEEFRRYEHNKKVLDRIRMVAADNAIYDGIMKTLDTNPSAKSYLVKKGVDLTGKTSSKVNTAPATDPNERIKYNYGKYDSSPDNLLEWLKENNCKINSKGDIIKRVGDGSVKVN